MLEGDPRGRSKGKFLKFAVASDGDNKNVPVSPSSLNNNRRWKRIFSIDDEMR